MAESIKSTLSLPVATSRDVLTDILRDGAQRLLAQAVEAEVTEWIDSHADLKNADGHRQVVRNGHLPKRTITTGVGPVEVQQPRVLDRRTEGDAEPFSSKILPPYLRKTKSLEELIAWLYLKGVSTGDFNEALAALVGPDCPGLSASTVTRLKASWEDEFQEWNKRSLKEKQYVYLWADGVHFNIRLEEDRQCILVLMGATADGRKELIAVVDGFRESEQSWKALLLDVKARGLVVDPKLATGDGALGFWKALSQVFPATREQRCWVHKTANVLDNLPKRLAEVERCNVDAPMSDEDDAKIVEFFRHPFVSLRNVDRRVARDSREICRESIKIGKKLQPMDAIHVATAILLKVPVLHTFDENLIRCDKHFGNPPLRIELPSYVVPPEDLLLGISEQQRLPLFPESEKEHDDTDDTLIEPPPARHIAFDDDLPRLPGTSPQADAGSEEGSPSEGTTQDEGEATTEEES